MTWTPPNLPNRYALPHTPALVLIDFQRDFCEAGGYADTIDDIGFAREIVPRALRLLPAPR